MNITTDRGQILGVIDGYSESRDVLFVACYGFNGERTESHRMTVKFSRLLSNSQIMTLRYDYTGLGVSEGEFHNVTLRSKYKDAEEVIEYIINKFSHIKKIVLLGFSDGARIALKAAINYKKRIDIIGIVLWSPLLIDETYAVEESKSYSNIVRVVDNKHVIHSYGLWMNIKYNNLILKKSDRMWSDLSIPILTVYGEKDNMVTASRIFHEEVISKNNNNKVVVVPEAEHTFAKRKFEDHVFEVTQKWIVERAVEYCQDK
ncbi:alpha/beta hydrolase [Paenibacillus xylaniclasticus]|uniref:alpha/beta hydrolase n=1 Tax=Paenibacillus xylaniclasticus TaxID=588083 RepID=UPI000FDC8AD1|nr:alpha/beta hydrolase [Paenibacillus xylaniclasticus]